VTGLPVLTIPGDAATIGVAMLAGLGAGAYRDPADAIARCVRPDPPILPDPANQDRYDEGFREHRELAAAAVVRRGEV
jgi:xylulokinase